MSRHFGGRSEKHPHVHDAFQPSKPLRVGRALLSPASDAGKDEGLLRFDQGHCLRFCLETLRTHTGSAQDMQLLGIREAWQGPPPVPRPRLGYS